MSTHSRTNPFIAKIQERYILNKPGSSKETFHLSLHVGASDFSFHVGDSVGVFVENDREIVDAIVEIFSQNPEVVDRVGVKSSFREFLIKKGNISKCTSSILKLYKERGACHPDLLELANSENKAIHAEFFQKYQLIDILRLFLKPPFSPQELCSILLPLMPRFYSIASSPKMFPHEIHLTVASLVYETAGGPRNGVGSHFLCHGAEIFSTPIPIYVQPSNGFTLPADPTAPMIMIGPGTGVAPFRAFIQERLALKHPGKNWLFFGERNEATDFYYSDYFLELERKGYLHLDTAFSRDGDEKRYVQHRLWDQKKQIWEWIEKGAFIYVCGDAEKMAKDVDLTLQHIIKESAHLNEEDSRQWLKDLRKNRRYIQDVY